jgi:HEAT repeat protein
MCRTTTLFLLSCLLSCGSSAAQPARFEDVVRNLRNPDPRARLTAVRLLREARHPEAVTPLAALVTDPIDEIQLEAIAAELSFFLVDEVPARKRVALLVEVRTGGGAAAAFDLGPLARWPRPAPPELIRGLFQAIDDEHPKVRLEAAYALGSVAPAPLDDQWSPHIVKALDHYDPAIRAAAARVAGRLQVKAAWEVLIKAVNDSSPPVRFAAMRALGAIREERAVVALTEQFTFYGRGEGAWSALEALGRIGHASSVPLFKARLADRDQFLRRAAAEGLGRSGDTSEIPALEIGAGNDGSAMARAAMAFALQKLGRNYVPRLVEFMRSPKLAPQIGEYLIELGPPIAPLLVSHLQDPNSAIRGNVALVLGAIGGAAALPALEPLTRDPDRDVARAASGAIERITTDQTGKNPPHDSSS